MHGVVAVLDHLHVQVFGGLDAVFGQDRLRVRKKARLQGVVLSTGGDQIGKSVALLGHGVLRVDLSWPS